MIRRSTAIATAAILLSLLAHFLGLSLTSRGQPERSAENTATNVIALGNTFEDVAESLSEPVPPEPAPVPEPPVKTPIVPDFADTPTSEVLVASTNPQRVFTPDTGSARAVQPDTIEPSGPEQGAAPPPETVEPSGGGVVVEATVTSPVEYDAVSQALEGKPDASTEPVDAVAAEPVLGPSFAPTPEPDAPQRLVALPNPITPVLPATPAPESAVVPLIPLDRELVDPEVPNTTVEPTPGNPETAGAEEDTDGSDLAVISSLRPQLPSRRLSAESVGLVDGSTELSDSQTAPSQLIESPLIAYQRDGTDLTILQNGGSQSGGRDFFDSHTTGNSDVTNYAGRVLVHLNRTPTVPISVRGFARVFFEINRDGTLARVDVIDGTGSLEINRAATAQVRNAAPFPRPPQGASRKLTFVYRIN